MTEDATGLALRPDAWGEPDSREAIQRIASDIRHRAGFATCVVEVLRADGLLEYVAIIGDEETSTALTATATPVSSSDGAARLGTRYGRLTFIAAECMTSEVMDEIAEYGHIPSIPKSSDAGVWQANDALMARLVNDHGLLGYVWLDEPLSGRRLDPAELMSLSAELELSLRALVITIERNDLAQVGRNIAVAREVVRSASATQGEQALLDEVALQLRTGFDADEVGFILRAKPGLVKSHDDGPLDLAQELHDAVMEASSRLWRERQVLIVEPDEVWGDGGLDQASATSLREHVLTHGLSVLVAVPISGGREPLGVLLMARKVGGRRWLAAESAGASDLGRDLGMSLLAARAQERERELVTKLRALDTYRAGLIATISHEMKTPLTAIVGHLELLEDTPDLGEPAVKSLKVIERSSGLLATLADDLLGLSRAEADPSTLDLKDVDVTAVLSEVIELNAAAALAHEVTIEVTAPLEPVMMRGVTEDLQRVLTNLVSNAVKYSNTGGVVSLRLAMVDGHVEFTCQDQGLGISPVDLERLFDEFFRSTNAEVLARPGTGLGLPIVKRIVERYGGRIDVESEVGVGSTFAVYLPAES